MKEYLKLDWEDIEKCIDDIVNKLKAGTESFNQQFTSNIRTIISLGRGGMIPARLLSDALNISNIYTINISSYVGFDSREIKCIGGFPDIIDGNILIVDDIVDCGKTIDYVRGLMPDNLKNKCLFVSLCAKKACMHKVDLYSMPILNNKWVIFAWEKYEFSNLISEK